MVIGYWTMPEEINRMVTAALADYYFTTTEIANQNLRNAGAKEEQIFLLLSIYFWIEEHDEVSSTHPKNSPLSKKKVVPLSIRQATY